MNYFKVVEAQIQGTGMPTPDNDSGNASTPDRLPTLDSPVAVLRKMRDQGTPISTGIPALDERFRGGMRPKRALAIGGTAGAGKTALALQLALTAARSGCAVACHMADEGREAAVIRIGQQLGYIREQIEEGLEGVLIGMEEALAPLILTFPDPDAEADTTIEGIAAALVAAFPDRPKFLLLDSIQTVRTRLDAPTIRERIMQNARTARRLALDYGLIVVYTSEVNRAWYRSRKEEDRASDLAAFAEARIEFSADVLLTMRTDDADPLLVDVRIPKSRIGSRTPLLLRLDVNRASFSALEGDPREATRNAAESQKMDETNAKILRKLKEHPGLARTQLQESVSVRRETFVKALQTLLDSGIVTKKQEGRSVRYYLAEIPK
jgi:KaiC/GvpD/RAD55 family RecA-like ATPase/DNA-binding transcriptional ArsR family regulator